MMSIKFNYGWLFLLIAMAGDFIVSFLLSLFYKNIFCFVYNVR